MDGRRDAVPVVSGAGRARVAGRGASRACQSASQPPSRRSWTSSTSSARPSSSRRPAPPSRASARSTGRRRPSFTVTPGARDLEVLRLRPGWGHLQLRHGARRRRLPDGAALAGRPGRRRDVGADEPRGRPAQAPPRRARGRHLLLPPGPHEPCRRRGGARLPARPRLHRRDHQHLPAGLGAGRLGRPDARR